MPLQAFFTPRPEPPAHQHTTRCNPRNISISNLWGKRTHIKFAPRPTTITLRSYCTDANPANIVYTMFLTKKCRYVVRSVITATHPLGYGVRMCSQLQFFLYLNITTFDTIRNNILIFSAKYGLETHRRPGAPTTSLVPRRPFAGAAYVGGSSSSFSMLLEVQ